MEHFFLLGLVMVVVQVEVAPTYLAKRDILEDNTGSMHKVKDVFAGSSLYYVRLSPPSPQKAPFMRLMRGIINGINHTKVRQHNYVETLDAVGGVATVWRNLSGSYI